jgi:hypothetical protein
MGLAHHCQTLAIPANISRICTLWKMRPRLGSAAGGGWCSREVLENHHEKSPQRWMGFGLYGGVRMAKALPIWVVAAEGSDAGRFIVHADQDLAAFLELESAIQTGRRNRNRIKYWEIIADNLSKAGWSWGCVSALDREGRTIWVADAHRDDGKRFIVRADEKLTAFLELERAVCIHLLTEEC